jgi:hypothetical protein
VTPRTARIVALSLPVLLVCVLASTGGWRIHGGRVERIGHVSAAAPAPVAAPAPSTAPVDEAGLVRHLSPSVPWPAWAGLIVLCLLPAVGAVLAWSGTRRQRPSPAFAAGAAP